MSRRVFAWDSLAYNVAGLGGPAAVTLVAVVSSPAWALTAIGVACAAVALTSLGLTTSGAPTPPAALRPTLAAAARLVADVAALRAVTLATTIAFAALGALSFAFVAATTATGRPAADAGIVLTVSAVGGLVGSLVMTRRRSPRRPAITVLVSLGILAALLLAMAAAGWTVLLLGAFGMGVVDGPLLVGLFATRTISSPPTLRATVFTLGASAKLGAAAIGALVAGQVLDGRSTSAGLAVVGLVHAVAAAAGWLSLRSVRRAPARPGPAPGTSPSRPRPAARP